MKVQEIKEVYLGYYGRAADMAGLNYWIEQAKAGMSIQTIAKHFAESEETQYWYPWLTTIDAVPTAIQADEFVTKIYDQALWRKPDQAGLDYWSGQLETGKITADQIILNVIQGAHGEIVRDLPKMEAGIYGMEIGATRLHSSVGIKMVGDYNTKWNSDFGVWVAQTPLRTAEMVYQAKHDIAAGLFMDVYNASMDSQQQQVMTDAQEAVIDIELMGIIPTF